MRSLTTCIQSSSALGIHQSYRGYGNSCLSSYMDLILIVNMNYRDPIQRQLAMSSFKICVCGDVTDIFFKKIVKTRRERTLEMEMCQLSSSS